MAKYKLKTHKGTQKRIGVSGSGKLMRTKGAKSHLRRRRSKRSKGLYDEMLTVSSADARRIRKLIPYGV
ncbi:MAG: 50S ribosomal protein L35 [Chloroflexi bacterium]|nr:50S ribosomal protein L35 [Chloroflexota bacterium]